MRHTLRTRPGSIRLRRHSFRLGIESVEERILLSTFVVTDTLDDTNTGSLRWAIQQANVAGGEIDFNISGSGVQTINLASALPALTAANTTIDATTQPGYAAAGHPLIAIDGTNAGPGVNGLTLNSTGQTVKGLAIDHFGGAGVFVGGGGSTATITSNYLGIDATGATAAGNAYGVELVSRANGCVIASNVISGNVSITNVTSSGTGIFINGADSATNTVQYTLIQGNLIGLKADGSAALSNQGAGISDTNSVNTQIGGTTAAERNIISGNSVGLDLFVSTGMIVEGNYIGTDITGEVAIGNDYSGTGAVWSGNGIILQGASNLLIGGTATGAGNVISGNKADGIDTFVIGSSGITVQGNLVGVDATGTQSLGNGGDGVLISGPTDVVIGGPSSAARNIISNNGGHGINALFSAIRWTIQGNYIGTDITGTKVMGNHGDGISIWSPNNLLIGGTAPGEGNVIVNNQSYGIDTFANGNGAMTVEGNNIGVDPTGTVAMGNGAAGVDVTITNVTVGGTASGAANIIANNGFKDAFFFSGVRVTSSGIPVLSNSIYHNKQLGIDLNSGQGNNNQPAPVITSATNVGASTTVVGSLTATANTTYTIQFFANDSTDPSGAYEGHTYLGSTTVTTGSNGVGNFNTTLSTGTTGGQFITATATDPVGNTSQFSGGTISQTPKADLVLTTSVSASTINVLQDVTYTLTVTNNGPDDATNAVLTDIIPAALGFVSATTTQGSTPTDTNGTVTAKFGTITAGSTVTVTITVHATLSAPPSVSSLVNVTSALSDPNTGNNSATIVTTVNPLIDLALSGSGSASTVLAGQYLTYTFVVKNTGPSPAANVVYTQDLPAGVTFLSANSNVGTASETGGVVTGNIGTLAANAAATITVVVIPGPSDPPSISSTGSVVATGTDTNPSNNSATVTTNVNAAIDLAVVLTASPSPSLVGQNLTYTIQVTNKGPSPATNVVLTQNLPSHVAFVSATSSVGTAAESAGVVTGNIGTLAAGATAMVSVIVTPDMNATPSVTSTASVTAAETDTNSANNTTSLTTSVKPVSDLAVVITRNPSPVEVGQNLTYTIKVTNNGPSLATGVVLTDDLTSNATFDSASVDTGGTPTFSNGMLVTDIGGLASGQTSTLTIIVTPTATAVSIGATASVLGNEIDPNLGNNVTGVTTAVTPVADLVLGTDSANPRPVQVGQSLTYSIHVTNFGPSPAAGVVMTQDLPAGFTFVSATPSVGTATQSGGVVTANLGTLASGATATLTVVVTAKTSAIGTNTSNVRVTTTTKDLNPANNTERIVSDVVPVSDLAISIRPSAPSILAGGELTYTLVVTNNGPNDDTGVFINDNLPSGVTLVSAVSDTGSPVIDFKGLIFSAIGNLKASATATITIVIRPDASTDSVTNTASVAGVNIDPNDANNLAAVTTAITPAADLGVTVTPQPGPEVTGTPFVYTLTVTNTGPSNATNVNLTANLPANLTFTSADPRFQVVGVSNGVVTLGVGTLNVGDTQKYTLTMTPVAPGNTRFDVTASANQTDPVTSNNTAQFSTNIVTPPGTFAFSQANYQVNENAGFASIVVNRLNGYQGKVTVHFSTVSGGSGKPDVDYYQLDQTLVFNQGATSETLQFPVLPNPNDNHDETVVLRLDTPTGGANLGSPSTALLTIHDIDPVTVGPTVTDVRLVGPAKAISQIDVVMTGVLDPSTVTSLGFVVTEVGTFGNVGAGANSPVPLASVSWSYNAGLGMVAITPAVPLKAGRFYEIHVVGTGPNAVRDLAGNPLNSTLGTTPGSDVVETFARGTMLNYADENGAWVTLRVRGGGVVDLNRDASGHVTRLQLLGVVPGRTSLLGTVHKGAVTTIGSILGMGRFGTVRRNLNIPPFKVTNVPYSEGNLVNPPAVDTLVPSARPAFSVRSFEAFTRRKGR